MKVSFVYHLLLILQRLPPLPHHVSKWILTRTRVLDELAVDAALCLPDAKTKTTFGILTLFLYRDII